MPDITMCVNDDCPSKFECYRYMAVPSELRQSYAAFEHGKSDKCGHFQPIDGRRVREATGDE